MNYSFNSMESSIENGSINKKNKTIIDLDS